MDKEMTGQILYNDGQCDFSDGHWKSQVNPPHYRQESLQTLQPKSRGYTFSVTGGTHIAKGRKSFYISVMGSLVQPKCEL